MRSVDWLSFGSDHKGQPLVMIARDRFTVDRKVPAYHPGVASVDRVLKVIESESEKCAMSITCSPIRRRLNLLLMPRLER